MRDIKFRGMRVGSTEWVYGSLVNNLWHKSELTDTPGKPTCEIITTENHYDCWEDVIENNIIEVVPETVGQFTGLQDKDGKDIYEGDILRVFSKAKPMAVTFEDGSFYTMYGPSRYRVGGWAKEAVEIIGNIYDHPELIK